MTHTCQVMVEGRVGVLWRADSHHWELKVVDDMGGDCGGNGFVLPLFVGLANQDTSPDKPKTDNSKPQKLDRS